MTSQNCSIESYFQPDLSPSQPEAATGRLAEIGDGFTAVEVEATMHPRSLPKWQPRMTYDEVDIETLLPGPARVALTGRVVNFNDRQASSKKPRAAKGCLELTVKDDTGCIDVSTIL